MAVRVADGRADGRVCDRGAAAVLRPHPLANVRFCPENIRRSFVLGVHCPVAPPASTPAAELLAQPFVPPPAARAAAAVPSGGKHFMSIL